MTISEVILAEVRRRLEAGASIRGLAIDAGIPAPTLNRFINGVRTLTLPTADTLAEHLGLELQPIKRSKRK